MSFVYGIDPDSHLLGGWQLDPIKLKRDVFLCLFALLQKSNCDNPDTSIPWTSGKKNLPRIGCSPQLRGTPAAIAHTTTGRAEPARRPAP